MTLKEFDPIITTVPLAGEDVFDPSVRHQLPAGQPGAILDVLAGGEAYEVEFILGVRGADGVIDDPSYCQLTLTPAQIRPDSASASRSAATVNRGR